MRLFIFIILFTSFSYSQSINLGLLKDFKQTVFLKKSMQLIVLTEDSLMTYDLIKWRKINGVKLKIPENFEMYRSNPIIVKNQLYIVDNFGGGVYKVDNDSLVRIDNSFEHKMQINSSVFEYDNTIYRYGGYGFWSVRNFFTYFDINSREWDIVPPKGSDKFPTGSLDHVVKISNGSFYIFGGNSPNLQNPKNSVSNNEVWKFNFKKMSWEFLGNSKIDFDSFSFNFPYVDKQIFFKQKNNFVHVVNIIGGSYKVFEKKSIQSLIVESKNLQSFYDNGLFYCFINSHQDGTIHLTTRNEDEFFGDLIEEGSLYETNDKWFLIGLLFIAPILLFVLFIKIKQQLIKKKLIKISNDKLIYKNIIHPFDAKEIQILKLLLKTDDLVQSSQIMDIVENKTLHYAHNIKVKNYLMENLNFKLKTVLRTDNDIITSQKSEEDKRIKIYYIDKSYFFIK